MTEIVTYPKEIVNDGEFEFCAELEREYRQFEHDQRMMWVRENDGTNQCIPADGWAKLISRIYA